MAPSYSLATLSKVISPSNSNLIASLSLTTVGGSLISKKQGATNKLKASQTSTSS
jgi:hypothetical protein